MSVAGDLFRDWVEHMDARLVAGWLHTVSVPTARVRAWLRGARRPFVDPDGPPVTLDDADATAAWVVEQARWNGGTVGGLAGLGGAASVAPEIVTTVVHALRLGQRLAVVYGFDPDTDRGRMVLWQALAAGFEVDLPHQGRVGLRLSELPGVLVPQLGTSSVGATLTRAIVVRSAWMVAGRLTRFVPVLSAAVNAADGQQRIAGIGERMSRTLRRVAVVPAPLRTEDALELG